MKSRDTNPSVAVQEVTPDPAEPDDSGRLGHLPIAVSEGDFSTPTQRSRTITRPRGLKTLEQSGLHPEATPVIDGVPDALSASVEPSALPTEEMPRHEASVVDEFLAAPPTPEPHVDETPAPDLGPTPSDLWGLTDPVNSIENLPAAEELRQMALGTPRPDQAPQDDAFPAGQSHATDFQAEHLSDQLDHGQVPPGHLDGSADGGGGQATELPPLTAEELAVFAQPPLAESDTSATETLADDQPLEATVDIFEASNPGDTVRAPETGHVVSSTEAIDTFVGDLVADEPVVASQDPPAAEAGLSPLAQTLANMAESMHADVTLDATEDLDIADGPLLPLADPVVGAAPLTPPPRPTPPPLPVKVATSPSDGVSSIGRVPVPVLAGPEALAERPRRPKRSKPWFEEVFDESYLRTLPFMTAEQTLQEVDFIESSLGLPRGSEVLDVACGYGRHAIELVQRGLSVTGVDLSLPLLIRAADESQRRSVAVNFVHNDMREMAFERQFSGAYCMLTSFGYFDDESNLKVAEGIARALKPGGRFLIDVVNRDYIVGDLPVRVWWEGDGCVVLEEVDFNFNTNRILTHRSVVFEDGQQLEQEISVRVYSLHELGKLLRQAGFRVIEVSGSIPTRGHFFGSQSRNLLILAERRSE